MAANTLYMTLEESERVQKTIRDLIQKRRDHAGQPRTASDPQGLIQTATSESLMQEMSIAAFFGVQQKQNDTMAAYSVGCPYPPSTAHLADLEPMALTDLRMETHHRGRVLSLRRVSPVVELKASSWAAMQGGSQNEVARLEVFLHKARHGKDLLDLCFELAVKEPYYTLNNQGEETICINHPSDLVITAYSHDPESWKRREDGDGASAEAKTAIQHKEQGNEALKKQDNARAYACYTEGLKLLAENDEADSTLSHDLHRNRSHVNLVLQRYDEAKSDAVASLTQSDNEEQKSLDAKAYYRAGSAAYALGDYEEARGFFDEQLRLQPDHQYAKLYLRRIKARLQEATTGAYDMNKLVASLPKNSRRPDAASFDGPTEVKDSPGAGRGLFATREIQPKEIIMCEKAFCLTWSWEADAFSALTCDVQDDEAIRVFPAGLHKAVVRKLRDNPSQASKVLDLFGDYKGLGTTLREVDGEPVVDVFQVHDIVQRNAFGPGQQTEDEDVSNASTGLWVRAAYINHSCVANAAKSYVGDLMVLRATRRIAAGEEITHAYDESSDLDARSAALWRTWGFACKCALCAAEEADGPDVRKKRRELEEESFKFLQKERSGPGARMLTVSKAKRLRQSINDTYDGKRYKGLPRRALVGIEEWIKAAGAR